MAGLSTNTLRAPGLRALVSEVRVAADVTRMGLSMLNPIRPTPSARPRTIVVLPGFGATDQMMLPLRRHLGRLGHRVEGWGLGKNVAGLDIEHRFEDVTARWDIRSNGRPYRREGSVPLLCERMTDRVRGRFDGPVTLIGWSLGGVVAREVARNLPDQIEQVITLGTPVIGGPKYTAAARFFNKRGMDLEWIERETARRDVRPIQTPIVAIYSPSDGIVAEAATADARSPRFRRVAINVSHMGMGVNPKVWALIREALERGE